MHSISTDRTRPSATPAMSYKISDVFWVVWGGFYTRPPWELAVIYYLPVSVSRTSYHFKSKPGNNSPLQINTPTGCNRSFFVYSYYSYYTHWVTFVSRAGWCLRLFSASSVGTYHKNGAEEIEDAQQPMDDIEKVELERCLNFK